MQTAAWKRRMSFCYITAIANLGCFSSQTTFWIYTSFQCYHTKILSVRHNQTGSRTKIFHSVAHSSNNYFRVPLRARHCFGYPAWRGAQVAPTFLPHTDPSLRPWLHPLCYLSSLLLYDCSTTCLGQTMVRPCSLSCISILTCLLASFPIIPCPKSSQGSPLLKGQKSKPLEANNAPPTLEA